MDLESRTIGRVTTRLVPFLIVCCFVPYLDRVLLRHDRGLERAPSGTTAALAG
jgi:hypothetical protein